MARASSYNPSTYYQQQSKSTYKPSTYNAPSKSSYNPSEYYKQKDLAAQARYVAPKSTYVAPKPVSTYTPAPSTYTPPAYKAPVSTYTAPKPVVSTYNPSEYYKQKDLEAQARYVAPSSSTYTSSSSTYTSTSYTTPVSMYTAPSTSVSTYNPSEYYKQKDLEAQARYVAPKPAYVAPNTTVSTYNPSEYYKQKDLEAQARANNSISTSVTKKAEPAATSSATPRINSAEDAKTYYNTLNGTSGSTNSNSGNVKTAANNVSSNISTTPNGTGKTNVTVTQQVKDNAAAVSNKVTTTTPKPQTTSKIVPGAPTEYYDNIAGKVASDNKQVTTSSPKTVNVKSTYNPGEYYKQKDLETQAKYVAPKAISAESKVTKPYNPGEYYKQKDLTAQTRAKTILGSNTPKLSANTPVKNLGINFDSNGKPIINSAEEAKVYMDSITLNRMINSLENITPNEPETTEGRIAKKSGLSVGNNGAPRINSAEDYKAFCNGAKEVKKENLKTEIDHQTERANQIKEMGSDIAAHEMEKNIEKLTNELKDLNGYSKQERLKRADYISQICDLDQELGIDLTETIKNANNMSTDELKIIVNELEKTKTDQEALYKEHPEYKKYDSYDKKFGNLWEENINDVVEKEFEFIDKSKNLPSLSEGSFPGGLVRGVLKGAVKMGGGLSLLPNSLMDLSEQYKKYNDQTKLGPYSVFSNIGFANQMGKGAVEAISNDFNKRVVNGTGEDRLQYVGEAAFNIATLVVGTEELAGINNLDDVARAANVTTKTVEKLNGLDDIARGADIATDTLNSTSKIDDIIKIADDPINYADDAANSLDNISEIAGSKSGVIEGGLDGAQAMLKTKSANAWGTLADGTNQGIKHFSDYWELYPERIPSIANRLGVDPSDFSNTVSGFENFTKAAQNVIDKSTQMRVVSGKSLYFVEGAENVNKGVAVIVQDGKIQSMMPTALKDFLKLK